MLNREVDFLLFNGTADFCIEISGSEIWLCIGFFSSVFCCGGVINFSAASLRSGARIKNFFF